MDLRLKNPTDKIAKTQQTFSFKTCWEYFLSHIKEILPKYLSFIYYY